MKEELKEINETLRKIENKIEDKRFPYLSGLIDFTKAQEEDRKEREEERNEEILKIQKNQSKMMEIQTESIKKQEDFNKIIALTGGILALVASYGFIKNFSGEGTFLAIISFIFLAIVMGASILIIIFIYLHALKK